MSNISPIDKNHQITIQQPLPKDYLYSIHAISLNLSPEDKKVFDSKLKEINGEFKAKTYIFFGTIIFSVLLLIALTYIQKRVNYELPFMLGLFIPMSIMTLGLIYLLSSIINKDPFSSTYYQTWKRFFDSKEITGYQYDKFYEFVKSFIKKTNSNSRHFIYQLYDREYLLEIDKPQNRRQKKDKARALNLLTSEIKLIEKLPKPKKTKVGTYRKISPFMFLFGISLVAYNFIRPMFEDGLTNRQLVQIIQIGIGILVIFFQLMAMQQRISSIPQKEQVEQILSNNGISVPPSEFFPTLVNFIQDNFPYIPI